jgi:glycosyltransferase involved in cell wall biosynthesis
VSAKIKESLPNLKVLIAGDGEEKENLEELADELNISTDIIWLGWQEDLENFYNAIDVMLFNSDWDAVGLSPLESIQRGIPTYTSVINGGLKEILTGEFSIFIENQHDINLLANKILESVHDKENLTDITMKCRDHVNSISKPENIAEQVLSKIKNRG